MVHEWRDGKNPYPDDPGAESVSLFRTRSGSQAGDEHAGTVCNEIGNGSCRSKRIRFRRDAEIKTDAGYLERIRVRSYERMERPMGRASWKETKMADGDLRILRFNGENFFLSNFYFVEIEYKGEVYPTLEHAYQAAKTKSKTHRTAIQRLNYPGQAKRYGRWLKEQGLQREDWQEINLQLMEDLLRQKFGRKHISFLWKRLLNTGDLKLIEGNTWNDRFYGMHRDEDGKFRGKNHLGKLLMKIREDLK